MDTLMKIEPEVFENAPKAFGRTEKTLEEDVGIIRKWLKTQPHLPELMEDVYIRNFLILNRCNIEKAQQKIDMYYSVRNLLPEVYEKANPKVPEFQAMMEAVDWVVLPKLTPDMYRVHILRFRNVDQFEALDKDLQISYMFSVFEIRLKDDYMFGDIIIIDMKGMTMGTIAEWTPTFLSKCVFIYEKVYSIPIKDLHLVNVPPFVETLLATIKNLVNPQIFESIHVSTYDDTILPKVIPVDVLPKDYGGNEKSIDELRDLWVEKFKQHQDRFDKLGTMQVKEELRPDKLTNDELLAFLGSFKKLTVD